MPVERSPRALAALAGAERLRDARRRRGAARGPAPTPPPRAQELALTPPRGRRATSCWRSTAPRARLASAAPVLDLCTETIALADGRCAYAEARHVALDEERLAVADGRIDDADARRSEGLGVRVRVGGALGLRRHARRLARRRRGARWPARSPSPRRSRARPPRAARARRARARALGLGRARSTPSRSRWRRSSACSSPPRPRCAPATRGSCATVAEAGARRERKALATTDGAACTQEIVELRRRARRPTRSADGEVQVRSYPLRARRRRPRRRAGSTSRALDLAGHRAAGGRGGGRAAHRARRAREGPDRRPPRRAGRAAGARVDRPRARARPHPRWARRPTPARAGSARTTCGAGLRYGSEQLTSPPTRRCPGGLGTSAGTTRASPRAATPLIDAVSCAAALRPRERGRDRPRRLRRAARAPTASRASRSCG